MYNINTQLFVDNIEGTFTSDGVAVGKSLSFKCHYLLSYFDISRQLSWHG